MKSYRILYIVYREKGKQKIEERIIIFNTTFDARHAIGNKSFKF
jgi:hypothetical protein